MKVNKHVKEILLEHIEQEPNINYTKEQKELLQEYMRISRGNKQQI